MPAPTMEGPSRIANDPRAGPPSDGPDDAGLELLFDILEAGWDEENRRAAPAGTPDPEAGVAVRPIGIDVRPVPAAPAAPCHLLEPPAGPASAPLYPEKRGTSHAPAPAQPPMLPEAVAAPDDARDEALHRLMDILEAGWDAENRGEARAERTETGGSIPVWLARLEASFQAAVAALGCDGSCQSDLFMVFLPWRGSREEDGGGAPRGAARAEARRQAADRLHLSTAREALQAASQGAWARARDLARTAERHGPQAGRKAAWSGFRRAVDNAARAAAGRPAAGPAADLQVRLDAALRTGDEAETERLLWLGADPDGCCGGRTPLSAAVCRWSAGSHRLLWDLVHAGANPNLPDGWGTPPLHAAVARGDLGMVRSLLHYGAEADLPDEDGSTPLGLAAVRGRVRPVRVLLEAGADVNRPDRQGRTPLTLAAGRRHRGLIQVLQAAGAVGDPQVLAAVDAPRPRPSAKARKRGGGWPTPPDALPPVASSGAIIHAINALEAGLWSGGTPRDENARRASSGWACIPKWIGPPAYRAGSPSNL